VVAGAAIAAAFPHAVAQPTTSPSAASTPEEDLQQYLGRLAANLNQGPPAQRDEAAQRLMEIDSPQTHSMLAKGLEGDDERAQNACAKAIGEGRAADPRWLAPLLQLLDKDHTADAAARALARYDTEPLGYQRLIALAQSRQQASRVASIRALGQIVQEPVAAALVAIVADPTEDPRIRSTAAESLQELSGQASNGTDAHKWQAWRDARNVQDPANWRTRVLSEQHSALQRLEATDRDRLRQFKDQIAYQFGDQYGRLPPPEKSRLLVTLLNSPDADVRELGAKLVGPAIGEGRPITDDIRARLIDLVGDASPDVRHQVVSVLKSLADPNAIDAILTQLQVENNTQVKIDLLEAVALQPSAKAIPVVEQMIKDPSAQVAAKAAAALQAIGTNPNFKINPAQAKQVFDDLEALLQARTGAPGMPSAEPGAADLRAAIVGAMSALATADSATAMDLFPRLLDPNEPPRVRQRALSGLAGLGEQSGEIIAHELDPNTEPDPSVRETAAISLGKVGSFTYAKQLDTSMDTSGRPQYEPAKEVREAAWKSFQSLLPAASTRDLASWAEIFRQRSNELDYEAVVRQELARKYQAAGDLPSLAVEQQRIGEIYYARLKPPQYSDAVPYLFQALKYWEGVAQAPPPTVVQLVRELMDSYLRSGQYRDAIQFGEHEMTRDPSNQDAIGAAIRNVAEALVAKADPASYKSAGDLINQALDMKNPALDPRFASRLKELKDELPAGSSP
jgi:HEAT repeat protein